MTRKDSEKDSERPHYYSQFWLDVASGRHVIGAPKETAENEVQEPAPRKADKTSRESADLTAESANGFGHADIQDAEAEEAQEEEYEDSGEYAEEEDQEPVEDEGIPDLDAEEEEEGEEGEEDEEEFFEENEEDEEDEEDIGWGGRGRKKPKPSRPTRPVQRKPGPGGKRDTRRSY